MVKVLFVCLGNICRSPTAEGIFRHLVKESNLEDKIQIDSCGTSAYHKGHPPDERSMKKALEHGIDISKQVSRPFINEDYYAFDYILAMDEKNLSNILEDLPHNSEAKINLMLDYSKKYNEKSVPDPYWSEQDGFEVVFQMVLESCTNLLDRIKSEHCL